MQGDAAVEQRRHKCVGLRDCHENRCGETSQSYKLRRNML
jgi:hypothetical protein